MATHSNPRLLALTTNLLATASIIAASGCGSSADAQPLSVPAASPASLQEAATALAPPESDAPADDSVPSYSVVAPEGASDAGCQSAPPGMACVPAGWFIRGVDEDPHECDQASQPAQGNIGTTPSQRVWLDTYYVDVTEVTNEAYRACVRNGDCPQDGPKYADFSAPQQPITGLTWYSANTFCQAQGKHLITEAEFEKATRGPDGEIYAWGNEAPTCERAILMDESGRACGVPKRGNSPQNGRVWEVASRPVGRYGLYDMTGNAEEWVFDLWSPSWDACGSACSRANPRGPCDGVEPCAELSRQYRVVRGGSWYWPAAHATGYHRRAYRPDNHPAHHFGFRCAASAAQAQALTAASNDTP